MALAPRIPRNVPQPLRKVRDGMSRSHLDKQADCQCLGCGAEPHSGNGIVAGHHLITGMVAAGERGTGIKAKDRWSLPLCFTCHRKLHALGSDDLFFVPLGIDPRAVASALWSVRDEPVESYRRIVFRARQMAKAA